tara:strand:+ start:694 stop:795 length:102 start_codon:yes stop_codon:yes gene_type:complete
MKEIHIGEEKTLLTSSKKVRAVIDSSNIRAGQK